MVCQRWTQPILPVCDNLVHHILDIHPHHFIAETHDRDATTIEISRPRPVVCQCIRRVVHLSVKLYGQPQLRTVEIKDISPDTMLAAKLEALHLPALQHLPQETLRHSSVITQLSALLLSSLLGIIGSHGYR